MLSIGRLSHLISIPISGVQTLKVWLRKNVTDKTAKTHSNTYWFVTPSCHPGNISPKPAARNRLNMTFKRLMHPPNEGQHDFSGLVTSCFWSVDQRYTQPSYDLSGWGSKCGRLGRSGRLTNQLIRPDSVLCLASEPHYRQHHESTTPIKVAGLATNDRKTSFIDRLSLRTKVTIVLLVISLGPVLITGFVHVTRARKREKSEAAHFAQSAQFASTAFSDLLNNATQEVTLAQRFPAAKFDVSKIDKRLNAAKGYFPTCPSGETPLSFRWLDVTSIAFFSLYRTVESFIVIRFETFAETFASVTAHGSPNSLRKAASAPDPSPNSPAPMNQSPS